ncbi:hypothetical protein [Planktotalea sp.]|uniref:hypothetical protein n=1 Tax=Planktotalea sp. TaxID=2029877 RepID=UPI003297DFC8
MRTKILSLLFMCCAGFASAQACPDRYRFVDFGLETNDGALIRGGTIFRAFLPDNTPLLLTEQTSCEDVQYLAKDGRQLTVPVVSTISVNTALIDIGFDTLRLSKVNNVDARANENAQKHHQSSATATRGDTFLCKQGEDQTSSCQMLSPFGNNITLVIYCDQSHCNMPALAFNETLMFDATWPHDTSTSETLGQDISAKLVLLHDFLTQHMDF